MSASHYDVLGVPRNADQPAIRKAYLRASLRVHPDKNPGREEEARAEFVRVGQAYSALGDPVQRAAYDRECAGGFRSSRRRASDGRQAAEGRAADRTASTQGWTKRATSDSRADATSFQDFADLFDETVAGMSETELNMAMGVASVVGSVLGSLAGARAGKGGHSALSALGSVLGSAVASQAASSLVRAVHEDSTQRALERQERDAAVARGAPAPEAAARGDGGRTWRDAGRAFQSAGASFAARAGPHEAPTNRAARGDGGERAPLTWKEAAAEAVKLATRAAAACSEANAASRQRK